jgi:hypothetical protein
MGKLWGALGSFAGAVLAAASTHTVGEIVSHPGILGTIVLVALGSVLAGHHAGTVSATKASSP